MAGDFLCTKKIQSLENKNTSQEREDTASGYVQRVEREDPARVGG